MSGSRSTVAGERKGSRLLAWVEGLAFAFGIAAAVLAVLAQSNKVVFSITSVVALCLGGGAELWSDSSLREQSGRFQRRVLLVGVVVMAGLIGLGMVTGNAASTEAAGSEGDENEHTPTSTATSTTVKPDSDRSTTTSSTGGPPSRPGGGPDPTTSSPDPPTTVWGDDTHPDGTTAPPNTTAPPTTRVTTRPTATTPAGRTWTEQQGSLGANTFLEPTSASGPGPKVPAWAYVEVRCKVHAPQIESANPDGYWYLLASDPWDGLYYAVANTFWNGDVPGQPPYTRNTDWAVPDC